MDFRYVQTPGQPGVHDLRIDVVQTDPVSIRVEPGAFRISGVDYTFDEPWDISFVMPDSTRRFVQGFIAIEVTSGDPVIVVDEFTYGSFEEMYDWESGGPYELKHGLFSFEMPANQSNLDGIECEINHIIPGTDE